MPSHQAAVAVVIFLSCGSLNAQSREPISLTRAFERTIENHPDLAHFRYSRESFEAQVALAAQRPALNLNTEVENVLGTGSTSGSESAEVTLSLASVIELGRKRDARLAVAQNELSALEFSERAKRMDLLAEVSRRYLDVLGAQSMEAITLTAIGQRERTVEAAQRRVTAGAAPDSVRLTAAAEVARAQLRYQRARAQRIAAVRRLAILWGEREPNFDRVTGDPLALTRAPPLASLIEALERSPELQRFANETRLREARVQLARTAENADLEWQLGVRRLETTDDWAAVGSVSIPLHSKQRAQPSIRTARAELAALSLEREAENLRLYATLIEAHGQLTAATAEVAHARDEVLPRLMQAEAAAERAYRAGALSYLEWAQLQDTTAAARSEQLQAALNAHRALIELQRLTGETFTAPTAAKVSEAQP